MGDDDVSLCDQEVGEWGVQLVDFLEGNTSPFFQNSNLNEPQLEVEGVESSWLSVVPMVTSVLVMQVLASFKESLGKYLGKLSYQ